MPRTAYVLKVYPRFSETFVVSEILAREAAGEDLVIFSLRAPDDPRFHPELARVSAPVRYLDKPVKASALWQGLRTAEQSPELLAAVGRLLPELLRASPEDAVQAVQLAAAVQREGVTHLHAHFASSATTVARLASLLTGVPYSFTAHAKDLFHESVDSADLARKLADASFTATVSDYNVLHLAARFPEASDRVRRVYNGLELERFAFSPRPERARVLRVAAVGRLVEKKGFALLVDAVAMLAAGGQDVEVEIAGGGELHGSLAERISSAGLQSRVRLLGPVPQNEVAALLRRSDVFVAPCIVGADGNADGLPTVLLEAMATGVPCISTAVTGIPEVVRDGDTGLLCRPGRVDDLARALQRVADPAFDTPGVTARARALVEREFDSRVQARTLAGLTREAARTAVA
ncbi:colanic acid biosynthesis glycosyltransferase WcaL [Rathayibacter caricis DSM 15933]|uniref:Colanic acid biosynthesis glycosyltransferase WcaL n=1 Tax=Rathayibacter caricis DSM 15933 TaxID=1328867 RepID=A0A2T4UXI5_9MICO|nr:glycosyltransferase [Rathayibacter caricis]PTL74236.1 colanic acid biosynthesis glycosyltransferase WcaL [Rathayibacter caricis DSM 15933]